MNCSNLDPTLLCNKNDAQQIMELHQNMYIPEAGIKTKCEIDFIADVDQEIHMDVTVLMHYEDEHAKQFIGTGTEDEEHITLDKKECHILYPLISFVHARST